MMGMGWAVATYHVVPILLERYARPIQAIKESAIFLKQTGVKTDDQLA